MRAIYPMNLYKDPTVNAHAQKKVLVHINQSTPPFQKKRANELVAGSNIKVMFTVSPEEAEADP